MTEKKYKTLKAFYPYYLTEHQDFTCRTLHFIGTGLVLGLLSVGLALQQFSLWWWMPLAGYGFAWVGHFFFEKNKAATFQYPLFSLASDFIMFYHILTFQIQERLEAAKQEIYSKENK